MNKLYLKMLGGFFFALLLVSGCTCIAFLNSSIRPEVYAGQLTTTPQTYAELEQVTSEEFVDRLYYYKDSECVPALTADSRRPNTADSNNLVPAFRFNGDTFVITYKWVNFSRGLAISHNPNFITSTQALDRGLTVWHLKDNVYAWDLERDSSKHDR